MLDSVPISAKEAKQLIDASGGEDMTVISGLPQKGEKKVLLMFKVDAGYLVQMKSDKVNLYCFYDLDNEPDLNEIAESLALRENSEFNKEIELYRWGVKDPVPAEHGNTFGKFKVLLKDSTGWLEWLQTSEKFFFESIEEAKAAAMKHSRKDQNFLII